MLVTIVAVPNADNTGLDASRMEKVEDLHPDVARPMLDLGTARLPSDEELAAYHKAQDTTETGSAAEHSDDASAALAKAREEAAAQNRETAKTLDAATKAFVAARPSKKTATAEPVADTDPQADAPPTDSDAA